VPHIPGPIVWMYFHRREYTRPVRENIRPVRQTIRALSYSCAESYGAHQQESSPYHPGDSETFIPEIKTCAEGSLYTPARMYTLPTSAVLSRGEYELI
jgi:hypothetical protein